MAGTSESAANVAAHAESDAPMKGEDVAVMRAPLRNFALLDIMLLDDILRLCEKAEIAAAKFRTKNALESNWGILETLIPL